MDKRPDFAADISGLKDGMDHMTEMLTLLRETKPTPQPTEKPKAAAQPSRTPRSTRAPAVPTSTPRTGLQNVTTRLTPETNELLSKAALKQELKNREPCSRQAIIEVALIEWFKRNGYTRPSDAEAEPQ